jgi:hypothetical protein
MLNNFLWKIYVISIRSLFKNKYDQKMLIKYSDYSGFRQAFGGYWGQWESQLKIANSPIWFWLYSECNHYPAPKGVTSTEPICTEQYI